MLSITSSVARGGGLKHDYSKYTIAQTLDTPVHFFFSPRLNEVVKRFCDLITLLGIVLIQIQNLENNFLRII